MERRTFDGQILGQQRLGAPDDAAIDNAEQLQAGREKRVSGDSMATCVSPRAVAPGLWSVHPVRRTRRGYAISVSRSAA